MQTHRTDRTENRRLSHHEYEGAVHQRLKLQAVGSVEEDLVRQHFFGRHALGTDDDVDSFVPRIVKNVLGRQHNRGMPGRVVFVGRNENNVPAPQLQSESPSVLPSSVSRLLRRMLPRGAGSTTSGSS